VDAVCRGEIVVDCKGKTRTILIPGKLKKLLMHYTKQHNIVTGAVFLGRNGKPMDRSSIWRQMKHLCKVANVKSSKAFPHNLRKLFACTFYSIEKDIARDTGCLIATCGPCFWIYPSCPEKIPRKGLFCNRPSGFAGKA